MVKRPSASIFLIALYFGLCLFVVLISPFIDFSNSSTQYSIEPDAFNDMARIVSTPSILLFNPVLTSLGIQLVDMRQASDGYIINFFPDEKFGYLRTMESSMWPIWLKIFILCSVFNVVVLYLVGLLIDRTLLAKKRV